MIDAIFYWNEIALEIHRRDFNGDRVMPEIGGPTRTSRAFAMVHLAMHDAWMAYKPGSKTYLPSGGSASGQLPGTPPGSASREAAVCAAAATVLEALFVRPQAYLDEQKKIFLHHLRSSQSDTDIEAGLEFGKQVGQAMIERRKNDKSGISTAYKPGSDEFQHRQDPYNPDQGFLDPHWGGIDHFYIGPDQIDREPPDLGAAYAAAFEEVRLKGVAREFNQTRSADETVQGVFWAYDGARGIGTPPRLYNQCVRTIALDKNTTVDENARLFALVNLAMADAGIISWFEKYHHNLWRPVIGIREAGPEYGARRDGSSGLAVDPFWRPYGSPNSNRPGMMNSTPNFPAYPSGHATFGRACFEVVRNFFGGENVKWEQVSDELDGRTLDPDGSVRSLHRRKLDLDTAIRENLESRIFLGVHWRIDGTRGDKIGRAIADKLVKDDVLGLKSQPAASSSGGSSLEANT